MTNNKQYMHIWTHMWTKYTLCKLGLYGPQISFRV